jgi:hypothetical protein
MRLKSLLGYSYRVLEVLLLLSITTAIVSMGLTSHDDAEMIDILSSIVIAFVLFWFITIPIFIIVIPQFGIRKLSKKLVI